MDVAGSTHIASINPIRYRGYYYDVETNLYYLNSRYYNPIIGKFINADGQLFKNAPIQGYNLYSYCFNNPVNMSDYDGNWPSIIYTINALKKIIDNVVNTIERMGEIRYDVPLYSQGKLNLCWAYCQTMIEDYQTGSVKTQKKLMQEHVK